MTTRADGIDHHARLWRDRHGFHDAHPMAVKIVLGAFRELGVKLSSIAPDDRLDDQRIWSGRWWHLWPSELDCLADLVFSTLQERRVLNGSPPQPGEDFPHLTIGELIRSVSHIWVTYTPRIAHDTDKYLGDPTDPPLTPSLDQRKRRLRAARVLVWPGWILFAASGVLLLSGSAENWLGMAVGCALLLGITSIAAGMRSGQMTLALVGVSQFLLFLVLLFGTLGTRPVRIDTAIGILVYAAVLFPVLVWLWRHPPPVNYPWECARCGYLLFGLDQARCPECGRAFERFD